MRMVPKCESSFIALGVVGSKSLGGGVACEPLGVVSLCTDEPSMVRHKSLDSVRSLVFSSATGALWLLISSRGESWDGGGRLSLGGSGGQESCFCGLWICGMLLLHWLRRELLVFS